MKSLDPVETLMAFEEAFGVELPLHKPGHFGSPREEMVDWLELHLSNQRPSKEGAALIRKVAEDHNKPELAERLEGAWRRKQIEAVVREVFRQLGFWV